VLLSLGTIGGKLSHSYHSNNGCADYQHRLNMHRPKLIGETWGMFDRFGSRDPSAPFSSILAYFQPLPAIFGLIFCFLTVFFFSTASWWNGMESSTNVVASMIAVSINQCSGVHI
jgi:hypothetical protein